MFEKQTGNLTGHLIEWLYSGRGEKMLKISKIEFWKDKDVYTIQGRQIQDFPLIGGTKSDIITTRVWNQNGNTYVDSYMQPDDGQLIFALYTKFKDRYEVEILRKEISDLLNPLNGQLQMKVYLNSGSIYNRDIVLTSAPAFLTGAENRNPLWQKIQLEFTANNPFWYAEDEIVESFQAVTPEFLFPFTMDTTTPVIFGDIQPNNVATNEGQVPAPVTITILGACTNPRIDNVTTGEFIKLNNLTMGAADELVINTGFGEKSVKLNGSNIFNKLDFSSTFFNLIKGDNEIKFTDDTGNNSAAIHFVYKNLFITI